MSMNATDELLRLLDERGAKYRRHIATVNGSMSIMNKIALLDDAGKAVAFFIECQNVAEPTLFVEARMTPTQAVLAMLGPDPNALKPIEGFTRDEVYRESILERDEIIADAFDLIRDMWFYLKDAEFPMCVPACRRLAKRMEELGVVDGAPSQMTNDRVEELEAKLAYLEGHGIEIVDAVAGGYEIYDENLRKADKLSELVHDLWDNKGCDEYTHDCRDCDRYDHDKRDCEYHVRMIELGVC